MKNIESELIKLESSLMVIQDFLRVKIGEQYVHREIIEKFANFSTGLNTALNNRIESWKDLSNLAKEKLN